MKDTFKELMEIKDKKFYSFTTACLSLLDETDRLNKILERKNQQVSNLKEADFMVVTTCAVSKDSANNSVENIIKLNNEGKGKSIYVGGCLSNAKEREILFKYKNIKFFTADDAFSKIDEINGICEKTTVRCEPFWLEDMSKKRQKLEELQKKNPKLAELYSFTTDGLIFNTMPFKFDTIRLSKGCNKHCSYCAIPNNRGRYIEHNLDYVKSQIDQSRNDYLLLIGENIGCHKNLNQIIEYAIKKKKKLMLRYLEPEWATKIKDEYLQNIVYIGIPIQSASYKILKDMNRPKNVKLVESKFKEWNKKGIFLGTSVILSYPKENIIDYLKTVLFIIRTPVDYISFQNFSPRENSPVFEMYKDWNPHSLKADIKFWIFDMIVKLKSNLNYLRIRGLT